MKRITALALLFASLLGAWPGLAGEVETDLPADKLRALSHNAPMTGIMLPEAFSPYQDSYLLTVASWVSRLTFTPYAASPYAEIYVDGEPVRSGSPSPIVRLTDEPDLVTITVNGYDAWGDYLGSSDYSIYIQRRPSDRRTRVSAGYISQITVQDGVATISADLVTLSFHDNSNISSFVNDTIYMYRYACDPHCLFYYGRPENPVRAYTAQAFIDNYLLDGNSLYYLIYIEDKIVSVFPYGSSGEAP